MLILEGINLGLTAVFLTLFIWRMLHLRKSAITGKYSKYYPKLRILFSCIYILLSVCLLSYNLIIAAYPKWYDYIFQGGGECMDSVTLILQLLILRAELDKQIPYTPLHIGYFCYLFVLSCVRLVFSLVQELDASKDGVQMGIAILLVVDTTFQMGYWLAKRQSLPQFARMTPISFDQFRVYSREVSNRFMDMSEKGLVRQALIKEEFPYLKPHVKVQKNKFRIILQKLKRGQIQGVVADSLYSVEAIMVLYSVCGRLPLNSRISFANTETRALAQLLQAFLDELFLQKLAYQSIILKQLRLPTEVIQEYSQRIEKKEVGCELEEMDSHVGLKLSFDRNCIYLSILVYRHLWVEDHYEFYMKVITRNHEIVYPMKRYSQFEDLHQTLKQINPKIELPHLPKKHLFHWNDEQILSRRAALEIYIRKVTNDSIIMGQPQLRNAIYKFLHLQDKCIQAKFQKDFYAEAVVVKGEITKAMVENQYVTFYQFTLVRGEDLICSFCKRFREFVELHQEIERWLHNTQQVMKSIVLPQKHMYKSQSVRQKDLCGYLQSVVEIKDLDRVYAANRFFNTGGNSTRDMDMASEMAVKSLYRRDTESRRDESPLDISDMSQDSRISQLIEDLGNEE